jgi:hypothetical protein
MNKTNILWIVLCALFLVVFNLIFHLFIGNYNSSSDWISYGFIHLAYLMLLLTPLFIIRTRGISHFGFVLYSISTIYFFVTMVVGLTFILIKQESHQNALITHLIILGLYGVILLTHMIANQRTASDERLGQSDRMFIDVATFEMQNLIDEAKDHDLLKEFEKVFERIRYSPIKSSTKALPVEKEILKQIVHLKTVINDDPEKVNECIGELHNNIVARNRLL